MKTTLPDSLIDEIASAALTQKETTQQSYSLAIDTLKRGIPGDFVECGVYAGSQCAAMALAIMHYGMNEKPRRRVHLFDSFQGIPKPGPEDHEFIQSGNKPGSASCSLDSVKANMQRWGIPDSLLVYHSGWFAETLKDPDPEKIALLRLDGDLYESTKACMHMIYPRTSWGAWVIIDDYQLSGCRKAVSEVVIPMPIYFQRLMEFPPNL